MSDQAAGTDGAVPELTDEQLDFLNSMFDLARQGRGEDLLGLVDQGIPVNLSNSNGDTLLILATYNGHDALVEGLLARNADVHRLNDRGQSALTCAVFLQHEDNVRRLLAAGADPYHEGQSPHSVTEMFDLPEMRRLLEQRPTGPVS
ncbi:MAG: ankyrin repeat domain-containing protein [Nesterenkonia sp.]|uniref:ankyrin repeat domain-containing protein n=1 Tax=Nesterenkonia marinintestina TaxID=2979865 RepID=UPI0021C2373D|nr:ankyrin repeat domain-containing protein [Nesterenkonia sp. GX14115]MDO5492218.1 ankyrin repeat domain-containing protein [Nesterenkonia sp.]